MQQGYVKAYVYTSDARIPIENAVFTVLKNTNPPETILGVRFTDRNGVTPVVAVDAPDEYLSQSSGNAEPFATVDVRIDHPEYKTYYFAGVQIFSGQVSIIEAPLLPADRNVSTDMRSERFDIPIQNL